MSRYGLNQHHYHHYPGQEMMSKSLYQLVFQTKVVVVVAYCTFELLHLLTVLVLRERKGVGLKVILFFHFDFFFK